MLQTNVNMSGNDFENFEPIFHFALIKDLSRLVKSQISKSKCKLFFCDRCLNHCKLEKSLKRHKLDCLKSNTVRMVIPNEQNQILKFRNYCNKDSVPFVVYADLECTLEPEGDDEKHVSHSVAFYQHCSYNSNLSKFELNRSPHCIDWFILKLEKFAIELEEILKNPITMKPLTN